MPVLHNLYLLYLLHQGVTLLGYHYGAADLVLMALPALIIGGALWYAKRKD